MLIGWKNGEIWRDVIEKKEMEWAIRIEKEDSIEYI